MTIVYVVFGFLFLASSLGLYFAHYEVMNDWRDMNPVRFVANARGLYALLGLLLGFFLGLPINRMLALAVAGMGFGWAYSAILTDRWPKK